MATLINMGVLAKLVLFVGLWELGPAAAHAADFELSPAEVARVEQGGTVIRADLDASRRRGTVRAAMRVNAPPEVVFQSMTRCEDALQYVPHLRHCRMLPSPDDGHSRLVEHEIDFGWFAPRIHYVFRADFHADRRIDFQQVSGDFKVNEGVWEFEPAGLGTLVRYRVTLDPPGYVPTWLARSTFRRELPQMLAELKHHCEAEQRRRAQANLAR